MNDPSRIKVTVIIPTYERFDSHLITIRSIEEQTHKNLEIIVINDSSKDPRYYEYPYGELVKVIHLEKNSREIVGVANPGVYGRNIALDMATGDYIGFCDDDDCWLPDKLEKQLRAMIETGCMMSCTEGYLGVGTYDHRKRYRLYNRQCYNKFLYNKYLKAGHTESTNTGIFIPPHILDAHFFNIHNCAIACSVLLHSSICKKIGHVCYGGHKHPAPINRTVRKGAEDYDYWLRALEHTKCVYIDEPCVYYDVGHGGGKQYL
jgi:glycosyltransferase involved in cell wall biosynthesis